MNLFIATDRCDRRKPQSKIAALNPRPNSGLINSNLPFLRSKRQFSRCIQQFRKPQALDRMGVNTITTWGSTAYFANTAAAPRSNRTGDAFGWSLVYAFRPSPHNPQNQSHEQTKRNLIVTPRFIKEIDNTIVEDTELDPAIHARSTIAIYRLAYFWFILWLVRKQHSTATPLTQGLRVSRVRPLEVRDM